MHLFATEYVLSDRLGVGAIQHFLKIQIGRVSSRLRGIETGIAEKMATGARENPTGTLSKQIGCTGAAHDFVEEIKLVVSLMWLKRLNLLRYY